MNRVHVRPEILRWACARAGFTTTTFKKRFPRITAWERGEADPTLKQLENFANATHTPLGYLFLAEPPVERVPIPDFRTMTSERLKHPSPDLLDTVYLCRQRQTWYRDFARETGEALLGFVGSVQTGDDVIKTAARIRRELGFDLEERRKIPSWTEALRKFIEQADNTGILVMVSGVVGSNNRRNLDPREFRGFALSDDLAPLVFINGADTKAAQMFTLAHELVHIWIGRTGLSDVEPVTVPDDETELWCNQVAAEVLVPLDALRTEYNRNMELRKEAKRLAGRFKVSTLVTLRRIHDTGRIDDSDYWEAYEAELQFLRKLSKKSGGDFYLTLGARVSKRFARSLVVSTLEGRSSFTDAFRLLGFKKMSTFQELGHSLGLAV
jgi:Zn-dependent peptidase ImmA (M78 family)